jgi:hypothetical protein
METNDFFEKYEDDTEHRRKVDAMCASCPVRKQCFAVGVSQKEWGVWGGVYLESGKISREFNKHNNKEDWSRKWQSLTMDG